MKNITISLSLIAIALALFISYKQFSVNQELVYVDVNVLLAEYKGMKDAKKEFEEKEKVWKANVDSLIVGFQNELKTYEKERSKYSKKELQLKQELLRNKQQQIDNYQRGVQKQAQDEEMKLTSGVIDEVNAFVKEYGKQHDFNIILGATSAGNILYAKEGIDITKKVIEGLNNEYTK
jgi:outer membrane protein